MTIKTYCRREAAISAKRQTKVKKSTVLFRASKLPITTKERPLKGIALIRSKSELLKMRENNFPSMSKLKSRHARAASGLCKFNKLSLHSNLCTFYKLAKM